jgi:hypothetical protein
MFGYPSGLGALLVRKQAAAALSKVYFGGGSVDWCTAEDAWHVLSALPAGEKESTVHFASLLAAVSTVIFHLHHFGTYLCNAAAVVGLKLTSCCWLCWYISKTHKANQLKEVCSLLLLMPLQCRLGGWHAAVPEHCLTEARLCTPAGVGRHAGRRCRDLQQQCIMKCLVNSHVQM